MPSNPSSKEKKLQLQAKTDDEELPPSILSRNPSSPPLNNQIPSAQSEPQSRPGITQSASFQLLSAQPNNKVAPQLQPTSSPESDQQKKETVMAGGVYLKEKLHSDSLVSTLNSLNLKNSTGSPTILSDNNESVTSLDYLLQPPADPQHHKTPSVHAHFYVDEAVKPPKVGNRSRSGSGSNSNSAGSHAALQSSFYPLRDGSKSHDSIRDAVSLGSATSLTAASSSTQAQVPHQASQITRQQSPRILEQNANIDPRLPQDDGKIHVLLGVCGALSTGKIKLIINKLFEIYTPNKIAIQLILTRSSENFLLQESLNVLENVKGVRVWRDADEWTTWKTRLDPVLHIELRRWADILVVCPLTANTLSKISLGICDNLLTNVIRAWNTSYPILLAPAMVSYSYNAITTKRQLRMIAEEMPWIEVLKPLEKVFGSYGDIGMGGMMDWNEVVNKIVLKLGGYPEVIEEEDEEEEEEDSEAVLKKKKELKLKELADKESSLAIVDEDDDEDEDDDDEEEEEDSTGQGQLQVEHKVNGDQHLYKPKPHSHQNGEAIKPVPISLDSESKSSHPH